MKAVILLSGGLDSVVNLTMALQESEIVLALTFAYGQAALESEERAASLCAGRFGVKHRLVDLPWYGELLPDGIGGTDRTGTQGGKPAGDSLLSQVWVPNRNCVFAAVGAAYAEALGAGRVVMGLNREEASVFPDNSAEFIKAMNSVLAVSTLSDVELRSYTTEMSKDEIVGLALQLDAPLDLVYSCYRSSGDQRMCGTCQSCMRLKAALKRNDMLGKLGSRFLR